jgi:hypothetical protein
MFISPYETTVCRNHRVSDIVDQLKESLIQGEFESLGDNVAMVGEEHTDIKPFAHPMVIPNRGRTPTVVVDVRSSSRLDRATGKLIGGTDFEYAKLRARLMADAWIQGNSKDLLNAGDYAVRIYARLMGENLGRRMNLTPETQMRLQVMAGQFFLNLFKENVDDVDEDERIGDAKRISRSIGFPVPDVLSITEEMPPINTMQQFTDVVGEMGQSIRLSKLNPGLVYTMLGGIWFGANANENTAVSLEHPPTFAAMLYMTTVNRSYRKSILGQMIQRVDRRGELGDIYTRHIQRLVADH